jgi:hypothetical protein
MMHHLASAAISSLRPNAQFVNTDNTYAGLIAHDGTVFPTELEIQTECERLAAQQVVLVEIARLESEVTQRRLREATLGTDGGWLANQEALIAAERSKL